MNEVWQNRAKKSGEEPGETGMCNGFLLKSSIECETECPSFPATPLHLTPRGLFSQVTHG